MKKLMVIVLILLQAGVPLLAQQIYEGIAAQGNTGEFPPEGYYVASNTFPRNSLVELRNPANGRSIQAIVVNRLSDPGLFMLLSPEAAGALGMSARNPVQLIASPITMPGLTELQQDVPFSRDPEVNPSAEFSDPNAFVFDPDSRIPELANPLLSPDSPALASARDRDGSAAEQETGPDEDGFPPLIRDSEPEDISPSDSLVILEELSTPELAEFFAQREEAQSGPSTETAGPGTGESAAETASPGTGEIAAETAGPTAGESAAETASPAAREPVSEPVPDIASSGSAENGQVDTAVSSSREAGRPAPVSSRRGLNLGLAEIREDSIGGELPLTGATAVREQEIVPEPRIYPRGILSAISRLQDGSNAVTPDFVIEEPDYVFWPPEYDANAPELDEEPVPELALDGVPAETVAEAGIPDPAETTSSPGSDAVEIAGSGEEPELSEIPEVAAAEDEGSAAEVADRGTESPSDEYRYAEEAPVDPAREWIERIRERYPDRQLFLPPAGSDLDEPLPRIAADEPAQPRVALQEAANPVEAEQGAEAPFDALRAVDQSLPDSGLPLVGFELPENLDSIDLLGRLPGPSQSGPRISGVPVPEAIEEDTIEASGPRITAPDTDIPRTPIPLAQFADPRPNPGLARLNAGRENLAGLDGEAEPLVPGQPTVDQPLPDISPSSRPDPELAHEPAEKQYGIEAGIMRLGAGQTDIALDSVPEPGRAEAAETGEPASLAEQPAASSASADEEADPLLDPLRASGVEIVLEPADYRSPALPEPREGIDPPNPGEDAIPEGFVLYSPRDAALLAAGTGEPEVGAVEESSPELPIDRPEISEEAAATVVTEEPELADLAPARVQDPEVAAAEPGDSTATEALDSSDLLVFLEESEPRAPIAEAPMEQAEAPAVITEAAPVLTSAVAAEVPDRKWAEENLPLVYSLQADGYYLQVGAFSNPRSARRIVEEVANGYPLAVLPVDQEDRSVYRVFVGPLSQDEQGMVLYWFRARGYRDAFIRRGTS